MAGKMRMECRCVENEEEEVMVVKSKSVCCAATRAHAPDVTISFAASIRLSRNVLIG